VVLFLISNEGCNILIKLIVMIRRMRSASLIIVEQNLSVRETIAESALAGFGVANMAKARTAQAIRGVVAENMIAYLNAVTLSYCMATSLSAMQDSSVTGINAFLIRRGITADRISLWQKTLRTFNVPKNFAVLLEQAFSPVQLPTGTLVVVSPRFDLEAVSYELASLSDPAIYFINSVYSTKLATSVRSGYENIACLVTTDITPGDLFGYTEKGELALEAGIHMGVLGLLERISKMNGDQESKVLTKNSFWSGATASDTPLVNELLLQEYIQPAGDLSDVLMRDWWAETFSEIEGVGKRSSLKETP